MNIPSLGLLGSLRPMLVAGLAGLAIGIASGSWVTHKIQVAGEVSGLKNEVREVNQARAGDAREEAIANAKSAHVAAEVEFTNSTVDAIKKEIHRYAPPKQPAVAGPSADPAGSGLRLGSPQAVCGPADAFITRGELWLLDLARQDRAADPAAGLSDAEGTAASDVTRSEFIDADLEAVKRFNRLKKKHDELVDYVLELQRKQRERLGASE